MLIAFPRKPGPQSVLTIGVLPSSLPLALLLCLFLVGQKTPCLLMGLREWVNWKEGHVTATKEWQQLSSVIPLTTPFQSTLLPLLLAAASGHILSLFPIIFALRHFRLQNIPFSLSQVCRSARFCEISTAHNLSECDPVVQYDWSSLLVFEDIRSRG